MGNKGRVLSRDIHEHKINLINEAAKRLGVDIIEASVYDARKIDDSLLGKADCVLVDAPCSGLGIIRRKPDIKWSRESEAEDSIASLQYEILKSAAAYVKPGGTLVYSTCTIESKENSDIVRRFLDENNEFSADGIKEALPLKIAGFAQEGFIQLFPNIHGIDGFFISKMTKRGK
jgi:16S rRNA (cytosine967-C5)-methyltransferase